MVSLLDELLSAVDRAARLRGTTRSGLLQKAARRELRRHEPDAMKAPDAQAGGTLRRIYGCGCPGTRCCGDGAGQVMTSPISRPSWQTYSGPWFRCPRTGWEIPRTPARIGD